MVGEEAAGVHRGSGGDEGGGPGAGPVDEPLGAFGGGAAFGEAGDDDGVGDVAGLAADAPAVAVFEQGPVGELAGFAVGGVLVAEPRVGSGLTWGADLVDGGSDGGWARRRRRGRGRLRWGWGWWLAGRTDRVFVASTSGHGSVTSLAGVGGEWFVGVADRDHRFEPEP